LLGWLLYSRQCLDHLGVVRFCRKAMYHGEFTFLYPVSSSEVVKFPLRKSSHVKNVASLLRLLCSAVNVEEF
jgi:hypothetical protein